MNRFAITLLLAALAASGAHAQKLYKWVDEEGNVTYQDQPPADSDAQQAFGEDPEVAESQADDSAIAAVNNPVTLFSIPVCDACDLVRNILENNAIPFREKDANQDVRIQDELMELGGQLSVPLLVIGDKVIYGYSSPTIRAGLTDAGYPLDGKSGASVGGAALSPGEVEEQAARAAAELTSDLDELEQRSEFSDDLENAEEIPEDERIKVRVNN